MLLSGCLLLVPGNPSSCSGLATWDATTGTVDFGEYVAITSANLSAWLFSQAGCSFGYYCVPETLPVVSTSQCTSIFGCSVSRGDTLSFTGICD